MKKTNRATDKPVPPVTSSPRLVPSSPPREVKVEAVKPAPKAAKPAPKAAKPAPKAEVKVEAKEVPKAKPAPKAKAEAKVEAKAKPVKAEPKAEPKVEVKAESKVKPEKPPRRRFTVLDSSTNVKGGNYWSMSPQDAAYKATRRVFQSDENPETVDVSIVEVCRGQPGPTVAYMYTITRKLRDVPKVVVRDGHSIEYKYTSVVKAKGTKPYEKKRRSKNSA